LPSDLGPNHALEDAPLAVEELELDAEPGGLLAASSFG
jgi:hypothetical protein